MNKHLVWITSLLIGLILLAGCNNPNNSDINKRQDNTSPQVSDKSTKTPSATPPDDTTDWKPSEYPTVDSLPGVTMEVKPGTASATGFTLVYDNKSAKRFIYGESFALEKNVKGKWYQVPVVVKGDHGFPDIGLTLAPGETREWNVDWKWLYGTLKPGEYRIVKDILDLRGTGDYDKYFLAAEFKV